MDVLDASVSAGSVFREPGDWPQPPRASPAPGSQPREQSESRIGSAESKDNNVLQIMNILIHIPSEDYMQQILSEFIC